MNGSRLKATLLGTTLVLILAGCSAPDPAPSPSATSLPTPTAIQTPPAAAPSVPPAPTTDPATSAQTDAMQGLWDQATPAQRDEALRALGVDPANPQPTDDAAATLVSKAAEYGYDVSEDAARAFLEQIAGQ